MRKQLASLKRKHTLARFITRVSSNTLLLRAVIDNSVYSVLISDYLQVFIPQLQNGAWRVFVGAISFAIIILLNFFGIDAVGWS